MKKVLLHIVIALVLIFPMHGQSLLEIKKLLIEDGGHVTLTRMANENSKARKQELTGMVVELTRAHLAEPATSKTDKIQFSNAARFLADAGDENAIIEAFKDGIDNVGRGELIDAVRALAVCRGEEPTAIIERLARDRLGILGDTLVETQDEDEGRARNDLLGSFARILVALASSANPSGMERAKKIRDEFAVLYPSENGKRVLAAVDADLAKITPHKSRSKPVHDSNLGTVTRPLDNKSLPNPNMQEAGRGTPSEKSTSSTKLIIIALVSVAICLLWLIVKNLK